MVLNTRKSVLEYMVQGQGKIILIINTGFSKTVTCINILTNHSRDRCKVFIKGTGNNLMICITPTTNI